MIPVDPWDSSRETADGSDENALDVSYDAEYGSSSEEGTDTIALHDDSGNKGQEGAEATAPAPFDGRLDQFLPWVEHMEKRLWKRSLYWGFVSGPEGATNASPDPGAEPWIGTWEAGDEEARGMLWAGLTPRFREDRREELGATSKSMWTYLHQLFFRECGRSPVGNNFAARAKLLREFWSVSLSKNNNGREGMAINDLYGRVRHLHAQLLGVGESVGWSQCIVAAHKGLPREYDGVVSTLESRFRELDDGEGGDASGVFEKAFKKSQRYMRAHEQQLAKEGAEREAAQREAEQRRERGLDLTPRARKLFKVRRFLKDLKSSKGAIFFAGRRWVPAGPSPRGSTASAGEASSRSSPRKGGGVMRSNYTM